jgi:hypothetical protein
MQCGKTVWNQRAFSESAWNQSTRYEKCRILGAPVAASGQSVHVSAKAMVESKLTSARRESNLVCCTTTGMVDSNTDE